ncbi:MAG: 2-oxo acid dehydrogenase subunit E2, partial [Rhizobiales bacterium]|nr:2-oxo acid dehydrogenase subunit E2 [Hyphomicrobiales bacterium]
PWRRAPGARPLAAPSVRRRAYEAGVPLQFVGGTGPEGRITHGDLDRMLAGGEALRPAAQPADLVEDMPVIGLRRKIAERMQDTKRRIPHFSYIEEVDVTALEDLRKALNERHGKARPRLTLLPFLVRALARTLPEFPGLNARYDDEAGVLRKHSALHVGIATQTPAGLVVPVLRHAEGLDLWACAAGISALAEAAREGRSGREDLSGSTLTITSLGALGGLATTPVINAPEVAIVGVNKIAVRPVYVEGGGFVPRKIMNLSSSFDHRVVDGFVAAEFVQRLRSLLEQPATLFVE